MKEAIPAILIVAGLTTIFLAAHSASKNTKLSLMEITTITCESQNEVFESRYYNEDKKQVIVQCVR